jgi:hypothetical protein
MKTLMAISAVTVCTVLTVGCSTTVHGRNAHAFRSQPTLRIAINKCGKEGVRQVFESRVDESGVVCMNGRVEQATEE